MRPGNQPYRLACVIRMGTSPRVVTRQRYLDNKGGDI